MKRSISTDLSNTGNKMEWLSELSDGGIEKEQESGWREIQWEWGIHKPPTWLWAKENWKMHDYLQERILKQHSNHYILTNTLSLSNLLHGNW